MQEKVIEKYLRERIEAIGGKAYKFVSPGHAGMPDRMVVLPNGEIIFVELKAPGGKPRPLQQKCIAELEKLNAKVRVIDSRASVYWFIDYCNGRLQL